MKILVVDDNESNRLLAQSALEDEGYTVVLANGGAEALTLFEKEEPDCLLLDIAMPGLDGFAVCERVRALPRRGDTPIIFLTAFRDIDTFDRALRAGADDFLTKPIRPAELIIRVQNALKLSRMSMELREHYVLLKQHSNDLLRLQLQKDRLTAFIVHDLKNPVNAIDLHAMFVLREKELPQTVRDSITQIRSETRQLTRMIMNLLDVSRADEGKLAPKRKYIEFNPLMNSVLAELGVSAELRDVILKVLPGVERIFADEDLLHRSLTNLVENAIRYAPTKSTVLVSSALTVDGVEIRVADAGPGVPSELRERVFDPFVQLDFGDRPVARSSRGLGLSFCKLAMEAHGGRIWIEDATPGSVFCVNLPQGDQAVSNSPE